MIRVFVCILVLVSWVSASLAGPVRIKDLVDFDGVRCPPLPEPAARLT